MNEFAWRRQLRDLRQPEPPQRDLWATIDAVIHDDSDAHRVSTAPPAGAKPMARWWLVGTLAASLLLAGGIGWRLAQPVAGTTAVASAATSPWTPADPRLRGAAIELDAARLELEQALTQAPDSTALHRLLARTQRQQAQLRELAHEAG